MTSSSTARELNKPQPASQRTSLEAWPGWKIAEDVYAFEDTCNVYVIRSGEQATLVDFGDGAVLEWLPSLGVRQVTDVLMTHHHRDQAQGLAHAVAAGARIWVPETEQDLFQDVEAHWQARSLYADYNNRQDRFSLLESVPVFGLLQDYRIYRFGDHFIKVLPTPGHTVGSISLLLELGQKKLAFTGDLIAAPGKVWSMAATQWSYNGAEGVAASMASLLDLKARAPDLLLPSHGDPIAQPQPAMDLLFNRFRKLLDYRCQNLRLLELYQKPYTAITGHLLFNRTSMANSYVLLSESGKALFIDFGYDFMTGGAAGEDRASRRPWLYTLDGLRRDFGVQKVDVVIPTHYHDDHVAGFNLLGQVEGTQIWAPENMQEILQNPERFDLPCLWYDPIPVDRVLPLEQPFRWEEHTLTLYPLPGHTLYAVAIAFEVDGRRVLAVGDEFEGRPGLKWNYVYRNRFRANDYRLAAELYQRLDPELILPGHQEAFWVEPGYFDVLLERGETLEELHHELLPLETADFGAEGFGLHIQPYQARGLAGDTLEFEVEVHNPYPRAGQARLSLVAPQGWQAEPGSLQVQLAAGEVRQVKFRVRPPLDLVTRRARLAVDLSVDDHHFGQQAEALVTLVPPKRDQPAAADENFASGQFVL